MREYEWKYEQERIVQILHNGLRSLLAYAPVKKQPKEENPSKGVVAGVGQAEYLF